MHEKDVSELKQVLSYEEEKDENAEEKPNEVEEDFCEEAEVASYQIEKHLQEGKWKQNELIEKEQEEKNQVFAPVHHD